MNSYDRQTCVFWLVWQDAQSYHYMYGLPAAIWTIQSLCQNADVAINIKPEALTEFIVDYLLNFTNELWCSDHWSCIFFPMLPRSQILNFQFLFDTFYYPPVNVEVWNLFICPSSTFQGEFCLFHKYVGTKLPIINYFAK